MVYKAQDTAETGVTWLALFTTTGTLVCCALPITLVSLGLGASLASLVSAAPFLVTLSLYKNWVFSISGGLLALSGWLMYRHGREFQLLINLCRRSKDGCPILDGLQ